jgi:predicted ATPase/class 3 adenylate cyclase
VNDRQRLETAIAALEAQRSLVGDTVTDAALAPMRERLAGILEHEQSLRQVTVLFMDVVGSTALSRNLDPEDIQAIIDGALQRLTTIVNDHQGRVLQYAGDSLLAVFGADEAREDDPERAVRCGLAIVREAEQIDTEVRASSRDQGFNVRVGIHTGSVLLGGGVGDASTIRGIAVNIAARMEQTAPVGRVRISHETQRHVRGKFDLTDEPPIAVKGFVDPVRSHLVLRATPRSFETVGRGIEGLATPMFGREAELAKLTEAYEAARDERCLILLTVSGDPGLGKTRLVVEFEHWLERNHAAAVRLHGRSQPYSNSVPYGLLRDLLAWHFEILDSDSQAIAQTKLARGLATKFGERGAEQAALVGRLIGFDYSANAPFGDIEGDGRQIRDGAFHVMAQYLKLLNKQGGAPVVLLLDDLHWADDGSLDFINHIASTCQDTPILLLCLTRPALFERRPLWCSGRDNHQRIDLAPLSRRSSRDLAEALLARLHTAPAALRDLVTSSAEGNPYFVEELISMLMDDGVIVADGERWRVDADRLLQVRVPSTLAGVLQARLDALPRHELATLQHASVIGHVFWDEALQRMAPVASDVLEGLMRRDLARGRDTSAFEGTREYVFKHHLLHKVTYDSVLKRDKREQHRLTAEWLVARSGERASEYHGLIADHFEKSGDRENAIKYLRKAASDARASYALEVALGYFDRALALMPDCSDRFDVMLNRCMVAFDISDEPLKERSVAALEQMAELLDDEGRRAHAASFRTSLAAQNNDPSAAAEAASRALEHAEHSGNSQAAIRAHNQLGYALAGNGAFEAAQRKADEGLALSRATDNWRGEASALNLCGHIANECGRYGEAREHLQAALAILKTKDDRVWENWIACSLANTELRIGHLETGTQQLLAAKEAFRAIGRRDYEFGAAAHLAIAAHLRGDYEEAIAWLAEASAAGESANRDMEFQALLLTVGGDVHAALGASAKAKTCYDGAIEAYGARSRPMAALDAQAGLALLALADGDALQGKVYMSDALERLDAGWRTGLAMDPARIMLTCHEVMAAAGDLREREFLNMAHESMKGRAELLEGSDRDAFLSKVPTNRAITEAWRSKRRTAK